VDPLRDETDVTLAADPMELSGYAFTRAGPYNAPLGCWRVGNCEALASGTPRVQSWRFRLSLSAPAGESAPGRPAGGKGSWRGRRTPLLRT
jgi:hypothetical protein